jgi:hypothetical protein
VGSDSGYTHHFGMFNGGPSCLRGVECEKWRCEDAPDVRSSGRVELCASRTAGRSDRIVGVMIPDACEKNVKRRYDLLSKSKSIL